MLARYIEQLAEVVLGSDGRTFAKAFVRDRGQGIFVDEGGEADGVRGVVSGHASFLETCAAPLWPLNDGIGGLGAEGSRDEGMDEDTARALGEKLRARAERAKAACVHVGDAAVRTLLLQNFAETMVAFFIEPQHIFPFFGQCF